MRRVGWRFGSGDARGAEPAATAEPATTAEDGPVDGFCSADLVSSCSRGAELRGLIFGLPQKRALGRGLVCNVGMRPCMGRQ